MDADEEFFDAYYDGDSTEEDDYYNALDYFISSSDDDDDGDGDGDEDDDNGYGYASDDDSLLPSDSEKMYTVLKEVDILRRQIESVSHVSAVLSISRFEAVNLLNHYKWDVSQVHEEWFADEERVRSTVGLMLSWPVGFLPNAEELDCGICFDSHPRDQMYSTACGHPYCSTCWKGYITTSINDGPGCLLLRCPDPACHAVVGQDMILKLASDEEICKYMRYFARSYVENKKKTKWCPAPDCSYAVEFEFGSNNFDVTCLCSHAFCWNCTEEAHRPVDCSTVTKWILKNSVESENMNWILANSKSCPKCKRPIEKDQGCMHITCTPPCKFEFCWLCLGAWADHGEMTGGSYECNIYEATIKEGLYDESEMRREMAKNSLERYTHYYERWASNHKSRKKAIADLHQMQTVHLEKLSDKLKEPVSQLKFTIEAWQQIIECRRVLKWTYAYGYYLQHDNPKRQFFEYLQGEAEAGLERLHQCVEKELLGFLDYEDDGVDLQADFIKLRPNLAVLISVTKTYFENLVRALENGLSDVDSQASSSTSASSKNVGAEGKAGEVKSSTSRLGHSAAFLDLDDPTHSHWNCDQCTFANSDTFTSCQMCHNES